MAKYKNIATHKIVIPNVGEVLPGETIETDLEINSSDLEKVSGGQQAQKEDLSIDNNKDLEDDSK